MAHLPELLCASTDSTLSFSSLHLQYRTPKRLLHILQLLLFAGGLLGTLILVMILYMAGVDSYVCLLLGAGGASLIVWQTFSLNRKYGEHGLMKIAANKRHPRYIMCRKPVHRYLKFTLKQKAV